MNKTITLLTFLTLTIGYSQKNNTIEVCGTEYNEFVYSQDFENNFQNQLNSQYKNQDDVIYYIPIVFHVIHAGEQLGEGSNLSDLTIYNALRTLNNNLRNQHNHANGTDAKIQYVLATKAPDGSCSTGINRVNYGNNVTYAQYGNRKETTDNGIDATVLRSLSNWNPSRYYNVWVVNKITSTEGVAGYAYFPSSHGSNNDGTILTASSLASSTSRTLVHEIGHSLNLYHTFQGSNGTNCPTQANGCGADGDCVADTPAHRKTHALDIVVTETNPCTNNNDSSFKHNYMSYNASIHRNTFSQQQVTRMRAAIPFYRSSYLPENNPAFNFTSLPQANFTINDVPVSNKMYVCTGATIKLQNISKCFLSTFNDTPVPNNTSLWTITKGGQLVTESTSNNPEITLTDPGIYNITLKATNNLGYSTMVKNNIIEVVAPSPIPYCAPNSTNVGYFGLAVDKVVFGGIINNTEPANNFGYTNFSCSHIGVMSKVSPNPIAVTISHTNTNSTAPIIVKGYIDYNENGTFEANELIFNGTSQSGTVGEVKNFTVNAPQTVEIGKVYRMRIAANSTSLTEAHMNCGTAFHIGDIEDYGVTFTNALTTDDLSRTDFNIYPNPTNDFLNVTSSITTNKKIAIYDISGKQVLNMEQDTSSFSIDVSSLQTGSYILKINNVSYKFIKK